MSTGAPLQKLFEPTHIGPLSIKNRIVMPAMSTGLAAATGHVAQPLIDYYEERARGGAGLIIVEITCVDSGTGKSSNSHLLADDDRFIPGLRELARAIQKHGARAALQLQHAGNTTRQAITGSQPVGPSAVARPGGEIPRELTVADISSLVSRFAEAAKRAKQAGFDGVEIQAAHSYLIAQFLSSAWNKRKDEYGGTLANRARFLLEILRSARQVVGKSFPVWCRINGEETGVQGGTTLAEAQEAAKLLEDAGADAINVSATSPNRPYFYPSGWVANLARAIKETTTVPIMAAGKITPEIGEKLLNENVVDLIAMGRSLRVDPELPNKIAAGRLNDVRPCLYCNVCFERFRAHGERLCAVNAEIGREREYQVRRARGSKQVLIVGGGPAGMEAARVAAMRGHSVVLCEKGSALGGQLLIAAAPPHKDAIKKFSDFLVSQLDKVKVSVQLETEVTPALVERYKPDAVIVAAGARPIVPKIEGIKRRVVTAPEVLAGKTETGERIVILGGGRVGCEVADFLAERGKQVTVVEILEKLASDMGASQGRDILLGGLARRGVTMLTKTTPQKLLEGSLVVTDASGQRQNIEADTIVLACGSVPNTELAETLRGMVSEIHVAGDSVKPCAILEAIDDGARVGRLV